MNLPIYFRERGNIIEKVIVNYNKDELEKIKYEIFDNCTIIMHKELDGTKKDKPDILLCERFIQKEIGKRDNEIIYHYSYDEKVLSTLLKLIIRLESGDLKVVEEIFNLEPEKDPLRVYDKMINELSKSIDCIPNSDYELKIEKLEELKNLISEKEYNINVKSDILYLEKVKSLISVSVIRTITKEELMVYQNFFDDDYPLTEELNYKKLGIIKEKKL